MKLSVIFNEIRGMSMLTHSQETVREQHARYTSTGPSTMPGLRTRPSLYQSPWELQNAAGATTGHYNTSNCPTKDNKDIFYQ